MKKRQLLTAILCSVCAVIWTIKAIWELVLQTTPYSAFGGVLSAVCAAVWMVATVFN